MGGTGSTYTVPGMETCPVPGHTLLYRGTLAGAHYSHRGSGATHLCMSSIPKYLLTNSGDASGSILYNAEYETANRAVPELRGHHDYEVPCAVCQRPHETSHELTVPARWATYMCACMHARVPTHTKTDACTPARMHQPNEHCVCCA